MGGKSQSRPGYKGFFDFAGRSASGSIHSAQNDKTEIDVSPSEETAVEARRFLVRGRVQGVGFRWFVEREAHILGIAGWVRNNPDSSVEVLAMGTRHQLAGLRSRLREGPRAARVDDVEEFEAKPVSGLTAFRIEGAW